MDKGISFCATCDAAATTGKPVLINGSGDGAIEESMFLTEFTDKVSVSIIHDEGKMDCNEIAREAALANPKMNFFWNTVVDRFEGDEMLEKVNLKNLKTNEIIPVETDSCFEFIGYLPSTEIFEGKLNRSGHKYIITNERMETNSLGVFACGDVREKWLKQVSTAVKDGAIAGFAAEKYIAESEQFEEVLMQSEKPGLIFVYDAIDPDSRKFLSVIDAYEKAKGGSIAVSRVDVYKSTGLAYRQGVSNYPAVVFTNEGQVSSILYEGLCEEGFCTDTFDELI